MPIDCMISRLDTIIGEWLKSDRLVFRVQEISLAWSLMKLASKAYGLVHDIRDANLFT